MRSTIPLVLAAALVVALSGCVCCNPRACPGAPVASIRDGTAPSALPEGPYARDATQTAWAYLRGKYDADGDGAISPEEHGRGAAAFERLDKDGSGAITESDLGPGPVHGLMVRMILMHWFQDDPNPMVLTREEFARTFDVVDANDDGMLDGAELADRIASHASGMPMMPKPPPGMDPYLSVRLLADADGNGRVSRAEGLAYFDKHAQDGTWSARKGRRPPSPSMRRPPPGAVVGKPAPDFTLSSPDGTTTVTLSDFRGKRPVALIFGSYT